MVSIRIDGGLAIGCGMSEKCGSCLDEDETTREVSSIDELGARRSPALVCSASLCETRGSPATELCCKDQHVEEIAL
jgi:hypothetical protein